jgi:hypothetical protein
MGKVAAVLLAFAVLVSADETTELEELTRGEWEALVDTIRKSGETTVRRLKRLREAASHYAVVEKAKILDVLPSPEHGKGALEIRLVGVEGGAVQGFVVRGEEADLAQEWRRWDRLSWRSLPEITSLDEVRLVRDYNGIEDLERTPNPGVRWPDFRRARVSFESWRQTYNKLWRQRRYTLAWRHLKAGQDVAFPFPATVVGKDRTLVSVKFLDGTVKRVEVADPQLRELIPMGSRVIIAVLLTTEATDWKSLWRAKGKYEIVLRFWEVDEKVR